MRVRAFKIAGDHAIVADKREGLHYDLPIVTRVCQRFKVARHAGGEHQFAHSVRLCTAVHAGECLPIFQDQIPFLHRSLLYVKSLQTYNLTNYTIKPYKNKEEKQKKFAQNWEWQDRLF